MNEEIQKLKKEYEDSKKALHEEYKAKIIKAYSINPAHKVGDIIEDHSGKVRITKILFGFSHYTSSGISYSISYLGDNLTKKGEISKREPTRTVYDSNIKKSE